MIKKSMELAGKTLSIETGRLAKQADGSIVVQYGDTIVLATVVASKNPVPDRGFLPLSVEFREKTYAAGRIPGGFFKREGRPNEKEVLACRLIDRPIRPLFPDGFMKETQVIINVLSSEPDVEPDILGILGTSAALCMSSIPWNGPIAAVRVGKVDGRFITNPNVEQLDSSTMDITVVGKENAILMVEGESYEMSEEEFVSALEYAQEVIGDLIKFQNELINEIKPTKQIIEIAEVDEKLTAAVDKLIEPKLDGLNSPKDKDNRYGDIDAFIEQVQADLEEKFPEQGKAIKNRIDERLRTDLRLKTLDGVRADGRKTDEIRNITIETSVLPRAHGSAVFTRGETQALATVTLGTKRDEQMIDDIHGTYWKNAMLHYNFPPFSVGEVRRMMGTSRREIGHGNLAERSITKVLPEFDDFPYTVRIVSEILESNGSSSMATVCGATLALMDAGAPIKAPVAGIAMGLIKEDDRYVILSDILGTEDHLGDMDFKVAGSKEGINAIQMDLKTEGIEISIMREALEQARIGRLHILDCMHEALAEPRAELSKFAPRIKHIRIDPESIGGLIGPGGRNIKAITRDTGCAIDVDDEGIVVISGGADDDLETALMQVKLIATKPEVGETYDSTVSRIMDFGAFVAIAPGKEGLVHISQLAHERVNRVEDVLKVGDKVRVKLIKIDEMGRLDFSRKALLERPANMPDSGDGGHDRGRDDKRGFSRGRRPRPQGGRGGNR